MIKNSTDGDTEPETQNASLVENESVGSQRPYAVLLFVNYYLSLPPLRSMTCEFLLGIVWRGCEEIEKDSIRSVSTINLGRLEYFG